MITNDPSITVSVAAADVTRSYTVDGGTPAASYTAPTADGAAHGRGHRHRHGGQHRRAPHTFTLDRTIATPTIALTHDSGSSSTDKLTNDRARSR